MRFVTWLRYLMLSWLCLVRISHFLKEENSRAAVITQAIFSLFRCAELYHTYCLIELQPPRFFYWTHFQIYCFFEYVSVNVTTASCSISGMIANVLKAIKREKTLFVSLLCDHILRIIQLLNCVQICTAVRLKRTNVSF